MGLLILRNTTGWLRTVAFQATHRTTFVPSRTLLSKSNICRQCQHKEHDNQGQQQFAAKLIYQGKLTDRIKVLKLVSISSSCLLLASLSYATYQSGFGLKVAGFSVLTSPFLLSPILIAWFFKRYVTQLHYNRLSDSYTIQHYGWLLSKKLCNFNRDQVKRAEIGDMLNTFTVGQKPFYLHDEDLIDEESVSVYRKMLSLHLEPQPESSGDIKKEN